MTYPEPIVLAETTSTNTYLAALCQKEACAELTSVYSSFQSAGRGQRGNSWGVGSRKEPALQFCSLSGVSGGTPPVLSFTGDCPGTA